MPRRPEGRCIRCGCPMWLGRTSAQQSMRVCHPCRRLKPASKSTDPYGRDHIFTRKMLLPAAIGTTCGVCGEVMTRAQAYAKPRSELALDHSTPLRVDPTSRGDRIIHAWCNSGWRRGTADPSRWKPKASTTARGYGAAHVRLRKEWAIHVATGQVACATCGNPIDPREKWHLGHDEQDRTQYLGPQHPSCNQRLKYA